MGHCWSCFLSRVSFFWTDLMHGLRCSNESFRYWTWFSRYICRNRTLSFLWVRKCQGNSRNEKNREDVWSIRNEQEWWRRHSSFVIPAHHHITVKQSHHRAIGLQLLERTWRHSRRSRPRHERWLTFRSSTGKSFPSTANTKEKYIYIYIFSFPTTIQMWQRYDVIPG